VTAKAAAVPPRNIDWNNPAFRAVVVVETADDVANNDGRRRGDKGKLHRSFDGAAGAVLTTAVGDMMIEIWCVLRFAFPLAELLFWLRADSFGRRSFASGCSL
jgi:hypothetical protein